MLNLDFLKPSAVSTVVNPFRKSAIKTVGMRATKYDFDGTINYSGSVKFKMGMTEAEQSFNGESFADIASQIETFIAGLKE